MHSSLSSNLSREKKTLYLNGLNKLGYDKQKASHLSAEDLNDIELKLSNYLIKPFSNQFHKYLTKYGHIISAICLYIISLDKPDPTVLALVSLACMFMAKLNMQHRSNVCFFNAVSQGISKPSMINIPTTEKVRVARIEAKLKRPAVIADLVYFNQKTK